MAEGDRPASLSVAPPAAIGPFRVDSVIGRGGMGVIFAACDAAGRRAAVKVLHRVDVDDVMERRFLREAETRIRHPNVVQVLDHGLDAEGRLFIAFELLEGENLAERLSRYSMSVPEVVDLGVQVCEGLSAAHASGIVHRDLKPSNIFICNDGTVKVLDFGVALWRLGSTRLTAAGRQAMGTPNYFSPEQACGNPDLDQRSDIFSLGLVLYEALTGFRPFVREEPIATMLAIAAEAAPPLSSRAPAVPPRLGAVIDRCLAKERRGRWASAEVLGGALGASLGRLYRGDTTFEDDTQPIPLGDPETSVPVELPRVSQGSERP